MAAEKRADSPASPTVDARRGFSGKHTGPAHYSRPGRHVSFGSFRSPNSQLTQRASPRAGCGARETVPPERAPSTPPAAAGSRACLRPAVLARWRRTQAVRWRTDSEAVGRGRDRHPRRSCAGSGTQAARTAAPSLHSCQQLPPAAGLPGTGTEAGRLCLVRIPCSAISPRGQRPVGHLWVKLWALQ